MFQNRWDGKKVPGPRREAWESEVGVNKSAPSRIHRKSAAAANSKS